MIVLDASLLIAYRNKVDPHHADAVALLLAHADDDFVVSALTLTEAFVQPARTGALEAVHARAVFTYDDKMMSVAREQGYELPARARRQ